MPEPLTDEALQSGLASLASTEIAAPEARVARLLRGADREWPATMCNSETPPSLSFLLFSALEALLELTQQAGKLARQAAAYDENDASRS